MGQGLHQAAELQHSAGNTLSAVQIGSGLGSLRRLRQLELAEFATTELPADLAELSQLESLKLINIRPGLCCDYGAEERHMDAHIHVLSALSQRLTRLCCGLHRYSADLEGLTALRELALQVSPSSTVRQCPLFHEI